MDKKIQALIKILKRITILSINCSKNDHGKMSVDIKIITYARAHRYAAEQNGSTKTKFTQQPHRQNE